MLVVNSASEHVAAAVIRAWIEAGSDGALKIRITTDVDGQRRTVGVASNIDTACAMVRTWLEGFAWTETMEGLGRGRPS
jgi:hypothetical protein